jgi:hypothetical protein
MNNVTKQDIKEYCRANQLNDLEQSIIIDVLEKKNLMDIWDNIDKLKGSNLKSDNVTADSIPSHYTKHGIEPIHFINKHNLCFNFGNVIKYISRYKNKNGDLDLEKVKFYADSYINGSYEKYKKHRELNKC